ncbi:WD repeat-containing protein 53-like [Bolinopsis microptera]|uniref:WD repeat-containing protein 53-like n=1 Tax=Bolinopsis microptera TaxID=2820187 RepID=UPI0030795CE6
MAIGSEIDNERIEYHNNTVLTVACCTEDHTVLSGAEDGSVALFSSKDNTLLHRITPGPVDPVNCVTFNPRETAKFYCALGEKIFVYDKRQLNDVCDTYAYHEEEINQVAVDEKGQYMVSCDDDGTVICLDLTKSGGKSVSKHTLHDNICASVQWCLVNTLYTTIYVLLCNGYVVFSKHTLHDNICASVQWVCSVSKHTLHDNICASVQWVPGRSSEIVSGGMDCKIHHRDVYKSRPLKTLTEKTEQQGIHIINPPFVNCVSTYWGSRYMVAGYGSGTVKVWRLGSKKVGYVPFKSLPRHNAGAGCVCLVDGTTVVSGGNDGFIHISELERGHTNGHTNGHCNGHSDNIASDDDADIDDTCTFKLLHGHKINWLSGFRDTSCIILYACDESNVVTKYSIR